MEGVREWGIGRSAIARIALPLNTLLIRPFSTVESLPAAIVDPYFTCSAEESSANRI